MGIAENKEKLWTIGFINLFVFDVLYQFGCYMTNTVIAVYAVGLGATYAIAGLMAGLNPGSALASRIFTGVLADILRKKFLLVASAILFLLATIGCAIFDSLVLIGICRVVQGMSFALRSVCVVSLVDYVVPKSKLHSGMGWMGLSSVIATALAPLVSEQVGMAIGYRNSFFIAACLMIVGVMLAIAFRKPGGNKTSSSKTAQPKPENQKYKQSKTKRFRGIFDIHKLIYKPNIILALITGLSSVPHGVSANLIILAAEQRGLSGATIFFTGYALAAFVGRPLMGRIADKEGIRRVVAPLFIIEIVAVMLLGIMANTTMLTIGGVLLGISQGSLYPVLQAESVKDVPMEEIGTAANTFYIGPDLNMCISPIIGSAILGTCGVAALYLFAGIMVIIAAVLFMYYLKTKVSQSKL